MQCNLSSASISEAVIYLHSSWHSYHLLKDLHIMLAKYFWVAHGCCRRREPPLDHPQVKQGWYVACNLEGAVLLHNQFLEGLPGYFSWEGRPSVVDNRHGVYSLYYWFNFQQ